jgi:hypothetical protein
MGRTAKRVLLAVDRGLRAIGWFVGQLTLLALAAGLVLVPALAAIIAGLYASNFVVGLLGGGALWAVVGFLVVFFPLIAWYVTPYVQPQIRDALRALSKNLGDLAG